MQREIKFRGWDEENKKMIIWEDIKVYEDNSPYLSDYISFENTPITLMQYTGLKDKNGNEIYEGDIVAVWSQSFTDIAYRFTVEIPDIYSRSYQDHFEIIGNIYKNPELLKQN